MTHPARLAASPLTVADAMRRINDRKMTEMCLVVNSIFGIGRANRLLDVFGAARRKVAKEAKK